MSRRKKTAAKIIRSVKPNSKLTTFNEVDMTNVMELRKRKRTIYEGS